MIIDNTKVNKKYLGLLQSLDGISLFARGFIVHRIPNVEYCEASLAIKGGKVIAIKIACH